jgi:hypothetical protein
MRHLCGMNRGIHTIHNMAPLFSSGLFGVHTFLKLGGFLGDLGPKRAWLYNHEER